MFGGGFLQGGNNNNNYGNENNYGGGSYNGGGGFLGGGGGNYNSGSYNQGGNNNNFNAGGNRFGSETKGNANNTPSKGGFDQKKKGSMIPLTLKALVEISSRPEGEPLEIDGVPVEQAVVIGRVYNVEEGSTRILFHLDDSTARAQIAYYKKSDLEANGAVGFEISDFGENKYFKAVIVVRPFKQQRVLVAHLLQPVTDYNQITYHMLSTFLSAAYRIKGPLEKSDPNFKDNYNKGNQDQQQQQQGGMGGGYGQYQQQNNFAGNNSFPMGGGNASKPVDTMSTVFNMVKNIMNRDSNGICRESQLLQQLGGRFKPDELRNALARLENNGQIHRSIQDDRDPGFVAL